MTRLHGRSIFNILGVLIILNGVCITLCLPFSLYYEEESWKAIAISAGLSFLIGGIAYGATRRNRESIKKREGYLIVGLGWIILSLFGSLPYYLSGAIPEYTDAFFETMSGYTTTGASILTDIEALPKGLLFWRSMTQWIGGMGMIVLAVAILPILGVGGMQLFSAEASGISYDKLQPRIKDTAKRLYIIYIGMTAITCALLMYGGMDFFDGINHALTTLSTGGFSTKNASVGYWDSAFIQYVITAFMFLGGTNFVMLYLILKGNFKKPFENEEFKYYVIVVISVTLLVTTVLFVNGHGAFEKSFRDALFQVISIVTTTGFATADFTHWGAILTWIFFLLMFVGGSAGSTAGGIKIVRHVLVAKNSVIELKRLLHPSAIIPVRYSGKPVKHEITSNTLAFVIIYITIFGVGSLVMTLMGMDVISAVGAVATSLGNVGPGLGEVGPSANFSAIHTEGKWFLAFLMMLGRLELFTVLILFTAYFWRKQ
jgi:trk system potassium uptake protein TrkH